MDTGEAVPPPNFEVAPCKVCARKFLLEKLGKHEEICQKAAKRKLKIFDSGKQRALGTDIPVSKTVRPGQIVPSEIKDERIIKAENKKHNWRLKHNEFISNIRSAKEYSRAKASGGPLPPPPPPSLSINADFILCDYCQRRFNEKAAERHIPFCKDKHARQGAQKPATTRNVRYGDGITTKTKETKTALPRQQRRELSACAFRNSLPGKTKLPNTVLIKRAPSNRKSPTQSPLIQKPNSKRMSTANVKTPPVPAVNGDAQKMSIRSPSSSTRSYPASQDQLNDRYSDDPCYFNEGSYDPCLFQPQSCEEQAGGCCAGLLFKPLCNSVARKSLCSVMRRPISITKSSTISSGERKEDTRLSSCNPALMNKQTPERLGCTSNLAPGRPLRSGRTYEDYIEAQAFAKDLSDCLRPGLPAIIHDFQRRPDVKPIRQKREISSRNERGDLLPSALPPPQRCLHSQNHHPLTKIRTESYAYRKQARYPLETADYIYLGDENFSLKTKMPPSFPKHSVSGIPVRAAGPLKAHLNQQQEDRLRHVPGDVKGRFCLECGSQFPNANARFCPDCGIRRVVLKS